LLLDISSLPFFSLLQSQEVNHFFGINSCIDELSNGHLLLIFILSIITKAIIVYNHMIFFMLGVMSLSELRIDDSQSQVKKEESAS
jgi:hypothetical protein